MSKTNIEVRLISKPEVLDRVGFSYPAIWRWMIAGTFPRCREVGGKSMWIEAEVEAWIASRPVRPLKGEKAAGIAHEPYTAPNERNLGGKAGKKARERARLRAEARAEAEA